ncbi:alkaline phosphatase PhoX [Owenweeksia hongkongensis]|uniref:alkaline phosphatase PhoX n=1 Tax=Owenweeksia hongkongensis TaxID=253245 RepID=UPI003A8F8607
MKKVTNWIFLAAALYGGAIAQAQVQTVQVQVNSSSNDAEEDLTNNTLDLTSTDLELSTDGTDQMVGIRFESLNIPKGAIIQSASIQFTVDEVTTSGNVDVVIAFEDADDAASISGGNGSLTNRAYTLNDAVLWNVPAFANVNNNGADQRTPDLKASLQTVVNRAGWVQGNSVLAGFIDPVYLSVPGYTGNTGKRTAESYNGEANSSPILTVTYTPPTTYQSGAFPVLSNASWKYDDSGNDLTGTNWTALSYVDTAWDFGNAPLGYNNGNENTTLDFGADANNKRNTYYLRHTFNVTDASAYDSLVFDVMRDDGVVVYVNGVEAFRQNMPSGNVAYSTAALATVGGADESTYYRNVTANLLQNGLNVIAVELHQATASSSDLSFDMKVDFELPPLGPTTYPLTAGTEWNYLDNGTSLDAAAWKDTSFNDNNWAFGAGPLGYGDAYTTEISYGPDANNKYITYYFRRDVMVDLNNVTDTVYLGLRRDDGAIVYINGVEVVRSNMPSGSVDYLTHSSSIIDGADETSYTIYKLAKSVLRNGRNQIAVEIHNRDETSSDIGFDLFLEDQPAYNPGVSCTDEHIGCFTSINPTAQTSKLIIAKEHKFQLIFKQGEAYTKTGPGLPTTVPGNHDFTGYVPMNGSSELGHLAINHENTPGGVSLLDLHFDKSTQLWVVDTTQPVDFYNSDLVSTTRNCSGGITPWGTVITSEESRNSGDNNNDGYQDVGWQVEIDPLTGKVLDYDNDGKQDKLWAMGRMSHENIVVADDSITAYYGEDGGSSAVFKFVADNKMNLSTGKVYALKLDAPLSGGDPTSTTASWILIPNSTQSDRNNMYSIAASMGATNFNGVEDCEISPIDGKIYFTAKGAARTYRFADNGSSISEFETFVGGTSYDIVTESGVVSESWGGGNDNLTFDDKGNLWVLQDGGRNYIWVVRPDHTQLDPKVELYASFPRGSEPTGLTFSPDYRFGFVSVQHPSSSNASQEDASGNMVTFNRSATIVIALAKDLGAQPKDSIAVVSNSEWSKSTLTTQANAGGYPWKGVAGELPADSTFSLMAEEGQPYRWHGVDSVDGAKVIKTDAYVTYFRKDFNLSVDTNITARFQVTVDDDIEIYLNGNLVAREGDRRQANAQNVPHDIIFHVNGTVENGYNGGDEFDYYTSQKMEEYLVAGNNTITVAIRNGNGNDKGGFSFRMDLESGVATTPVQTDSIVSDNLWKLSTISTNATSQQFPWMGVASLPADSTFSIPAEVGQPYSWNSILEVPGSSVLKAEENVTYYRTWFELSDNMDLNTRIRSYFDDNVEVYINGTLVAREQDMFGMDNFTGNAHDLMLNADGTMVNPNAGGDAFDYVGAADMDTVYQVGMNHVTVALRNRTGDKGGFSFRMDLDKAGDAVIVKKNAEASAEGAASFAVYPNPTSGVINIALPQATASEVMIFNINGKLMYHADAQTEVEVDLSAYPAGVYFLKVKNGSENFTEKLIKH